MTQAHRLALASTAAVLLLGLDAAPAHADRDRVYRGRSGVRVGGSVRAGGYVRAGRPYARDHRTTYRGGTYRPRRSVVVAPGLYWGGGVYLGGYSSYGSYGYYDGCYGGCGYAVPPPPPPCTTCGYYEAPPAVAAVAAPAPAPLPRFGIGVFGGGSAFEHGAEGQDIGLLARFRLTPHILLEGELAKSELYEGQRIDRSGGGAVLLDVAPWSRLSVYVLAGGGAGSSEIGGAKGQTPHVYGEVGIGLDWRLTSQLAIVADIRGGQRDARKRDEEVIALQRQPSIGSVDPSEEFSRARLGLLLSF